MFALFVTLGIVSYIVLMILFRAFVFIKLYSWFIVPMIAPAVLHISYPIAIGLSLIASLFFMPFKANESNKKAIFTGFFFLVMILLMGWITHLFM
jgi:cation transport ATPase